MKKFLKFLVWMAVVVALLLAAAHVTLALALNSEKVKTAVTGWLERSTGWKVGYARLAGGLFPPRLEMKDAAAEEASGEWKVAVGTVSLALDVRRREVSALTVERPVVRHRAPPKGTPEAREGRGGGGGGGTGGAASGAGGAAKPKELPPLPADGFALKRLEIAGGRYEEVGADGTAKVAVDGISLVAENVSLDQPVQAELAFWLGAETNAGKVSLNAGAPREWWGRPGDWPVRLRMDLMLEDLAAAARALGGLETGLLQRPGLWANFVGTPVSGITLSGAFTDGRRHQSPDISVNWKGTVHTGDPLDARAALEGFAAQVEIGIPVFRWGALATKDGKGTVEACWGEKGPEAKGQVELGEIATASDGESLVGRTLAALRETAAAKWLPGLAAAGDGADGGTILWGKASAAANWRGDLLTLDSLKAESPLFTASAVGTADTAAKTLDLRAELATTPEETARLAGGLSLEGWMPSRDGCLLFPLSITGPWERPLVAPDAGVWENHVREQLARPETQEKIGREIERGLDKLELHGKDRKNVETGLKLLNRFLQ